MNRLFIIDEAGIFANNAKAFFSTRGFAVVICRSVDDIAHEKDIKNQTVLFFDNDNSYDVQKLGLLSKTNYCTSLVITENSAPEFRIMLLSRGIDDIIHKPISLYELELRIKRFDKQKEKQQKFGDSLFIDYPKFNMALTKSQEKLLRCFENNRNQVLSPFFLVEELQLPSKPALTVLVHRTNKLFTRWLVPYRLKSIYSRGYLLSEKEVKYLGTFRK